MRDLAPNLAFQTVLSPAVQAAAVNSQIVDTKDFGSVAFVAHTGAVAGGGDFGFKLQESDTTTLGDFTDVPAEQRSGTVPATLGADSTAKLSYTGWKRYVRAVLTKAGGTSIVAGVMAVKGRARNRPVA